MIKGILYITYIQKKLQHIKRKYYIKYEIHIKYTIK
jgi:hypothetical protein